MAGFSYFIKCDRRDILEQVVKQSPLSEYWLRIGGKRYCTLDGGGYVFAIKGKDNNVVPGIGEEGTQNIIDFEGYKLIYSIDDPPKPEDFLKKDAIAGNFVELNDGNEWMIPMARKFDEGSVLPEALVVSTSDPSGFKMQPIKKFLELSEIAERTVEDCLISLGQLKAERNYVTIDEVFNACFKIIKTNYDITQEEISALELITNHNFNKITQALIDWESIKEAMTSEVHQKKTLELLKKNLDYVNL